ncbi:23S rRNA (guanine745-N1)-methyltransferase [Paenibacillus tianmuensis]|uniref:23S rRNA (Guanine745-N1)-methyltransferase n=1 Tax=Paenibacillus tianmuensis TaxID=624147 RepID=A0A1G4TGH5_9BACL|nr:methyltransferase domain-containing protein [Paenibacillus tianmuensis]SCW80367.1 23S rRNA (guanine745-N1)-methyltransferase [Paenibacillus tianmuensis]
MNASLLDPRIHPDWLRPHSIEWYAQLGRIKGQYSFSWHSTIAEPNAEAIFAEEVSQAVRGRKVLDIGCGHGEFTLQWSPIVKHITGLDITSDFIKTGKEANLSNVTFITGNTKHRLPFEPDEFDAAYNRRGPTSSYLDVRRVVKKGGKILGSHPGDGIAAELSEWFPNLFEPISAGTPLLENLKQRLEQGGLGHAEIETVRSMEYFHEPVDVIRMCCFGQTPSIHEWVMEKCFTEVTRRFEINAAQEGLPVTFERYLVRVTV